jgi:hypothetical protein
MPFVGLTKGSKSRGIQTYARAMTLIPELRDVELEYLSIRDWYMQTLSILAQYEEAYVQAKASRDRALETEFRNKITAINSSLQDVRDRCRLAGERSFAEAVYLAMSKMLPSEVRATIEIEAENLLGRPRTELRRNA